MAMETAKQTIHTNINTSSIQYSSGLQTSTRQVDSSQAGALPYSLTNKSVLGVRGGHREDGKFVRDFVSILGRQVADRKELLGREGSHPYGEYNNLIKRQTASNPFSSRTRSFWSGSPAWLDSLNGSSFQRKLGFEQAALGLESQMLNDGVGVRLNPRGTNLYVRNYGAGLIPESAPLVELLARQEKLIIDEAGKSNKPVK